MLSFEWSPRELRGVWVETENTDDPVFFVHLIWQREQDPGQGRCEDGDGSENFAGKVNSRSFNLQRDYLIQVTYFVKCR